ncbi:penicillin-binding protein 1B [Yersinia enterocolitica]|nr:penicillin-binding protein 1B [Yersinia enterocolitica]ELI7924462.1 penicillin-binding protein 1B [Yersinia enterocolitica]
MKIDKQDPRKKRPLQKFYLPLFLIVLASSVALLSLYMYELAGKIDKDIRQRMSDGIWDMPAQIYSKSWVLNEGEDRSMNSVIRMLESSRYHETRGEPSPGEYQRQNNSIRLYRREFALADHILLPARFRLSFSNGKLHHITKEGRKQDITSIEIEPRLVSMMYTTSDEQRIFMPLQRYPKTLINMLTATEDRDFWHHPGIDITAISRAFVNNLRARKVIEGGSTITQQVIKNLFLSRDKTYSRKGREMLMALILERKYSKSQILEIYLNEVYLGQDGAKGIHGFPLAAMYYFGRQVNELTPAQQALLIGMAKGASLYNPWIRPETALKRRNIVLHTARARGAIVEAEFLEAVKSELRVQHKGTEFIQHPAFISMIKKELNELQNIDLNALSGSRIFTTFDPVIQKDAELSVSGVMPILEKQTGHADLQAALVVVENRTGNLLAVIGDKNVDYNGFNRAVSATRQIGSLVKPFVYLSALKNPDLFSLNTLLEDHPVSIDLGGGKYWAPKNYNRRYSGSVLLVDALARSVNVATVNLGLTVGLSTVANVLQDTGIPEKRIMQSPSMLLGTLDMSPFELTEGFQTIANLGKHTGVSTLLFVQGQDGKNLYQRSVMPAQVVPTEAAWLVLYGMQQSVKYGTSRKLGYDFKAYSLAGKTGTSSNNRDSWFTGIDGERVIVAWIGRDNNQPTKLWGASGSLLLARGFFERNGVIPLHLTLPNNIYNTMVNQDGTVNCDLEYLPEEVKSQFRHLPIWGLNQKQICQSGDQFLPISTEKLYLLDTLDSLF